MVAVQGMTELAGMVVAVAGMLAFVALEAVRRKSIQGSAPPFGMPCLATG